MTAFKVGDRVMAIHGNFKGEVRGHYTLDTGVSGVVVQQGLEPLRCMDTSQLTLIPKPLEWWCVIRADNNFPTVTFATEQLACEWNRDSSDYRIVHMREVE